MDAYWDLSWCQDWVCLVVFFSLASYLLVGCCLNAFWNKQQVVHSYICYTFFSLFTKHISNKNVFVIHKYKTQMQVARHLRGNVWRMSPYSHSTRVDFLFPQDTRPFIALGGCFQWLLLIHNGHGLWTYLQSKVLVFRWTQTHSSHTWLWSTALSAAWRQESSHS